MKPGTLLSIAMAFTGLAAIALPELWSGEKHPQFWWIWMFSLGVPGIAFGGYGLVGWLKGDPTPGPDLDIDEFLCLWLGYDWHGHGSTNHARANNTINEAHKAMDAIAEAARLGTITVWGRKNQIVEATVPLSPIPAGAWDRIKIDALELLSGQEPHEVRTRDYHRYQTYWSDIHLSRMQVRQTWPKIARKVPFGTP